jgi:hypothetical protein
MSAEPKKCPFEHSGGTTYRDWWPGQLRLDLLHQHSAKSDPMGEDFYYAKEFASLDFAALKRDLAALMLPRPDGVRSLPPKLFPAVGCPKRSAIFTSSANDLAPIFVIMRPLCAFTVISLIPRSPPTCLFSSPRTTSAMTCRSRGVSKS